MAQSRATKMIRFFVRLMLAAFLFIFMPMLVFKGACGEKREATLSEAYGKEGAPRLDDDAPPQKGPKVEGKAAPKADAEPTTAPKPAEKPVPEAQPTK